MHRRALLVSILLPLAACGGPADAPEVISYDHVACDECGMIVGDPHFAAQLLTKDGQRKEFDDPACAFKYILTNHPSLVHVWFRDATASEERWLDESSAVFVPTKGAPMNGGWTAAPIGTPGGVSFGEASSASIGASN